MTQIQKIQKTQKSKSDDSLDRVRAAAQELHRAVSDAKANPGEVMKTKLQAILPKAKAVTASLKESIGAQREGVQTHLAMAIAQLEATQKHVAETMKSTGSTEGQ